MYRAMSVYEYFDFATYLTSSRPLKLDSCGTGSPVWIVAVSPTFGSEALTSEIHWRLTCTRGGNVLCSFGA